MDACTPRSLYFAYAKGVSLGIADGVGGWVTSGVDPSLFSQSLMYHAHRYAKVGWPGEPEIDPTQDYEDQETIEGWELNPRDCLQLAHDAVRRERFVLAGAFSCTDLARTCKSDCIRRATEQARVLPAF